MAKYIYGCTHKQHPRIEVEHGINEPYLARCKVCGNYLHRIPQPFLFGLSPITLIRDWSERQWTKKLRGEPRDYTNISDVRGKPQKDFNSRE